MNRILLIVWAGLLLIAGGASSVVQPWTTTARAGGSPSAAQTRTTTAPIESGILERGRLWNWWYFHQQLSPDDPAVAALLMRIRTNDGAQYRAEDQFLASQLLGRRGLPHLKDRAKSLELLQESSDAGLPQAQAVLGLFHLHGSDVPQDTNRALSLIGEAVKQGSAEGFLSRGISLISGVVGIARDTDAAIADFEKAASLGHPRAFFFLATIQLERGQTEPALRNLWIGVYSNDPQAKDGLARVLWSGQTGPPQREQALELARSAAAAGYPEYRYNVALMLVHRGSPDDLLEAEQMLAEAARSGHISALYLHGALHVKGTFANSDRALGVRELKAAAEAGSEQARAILKQLDVPQR